MKSNIIQYMHNLLSYNIIGEMQYKARYNGFIGELDFFKWFKENKPNKVMSGGIFIPLVDTDDSFEEAIYIIAMPKGEVDEQLIKEHFKVVSTLAKNGAYLIHYDENEELKSWIELKIPSSNEFGYVSIPYPSTLQVVSYNLESDFLNDIELADFFDLIGLKPFFYKKARIPKEMVELFYEKLSTYETCDLISLYISRFVLDALCSRMTNPHEVQRGAPLDIDMLVFGNDNKWHVVEIKEKYLSKNSCFGLDVRRLESILKIQRAFNANAYLIVRHIKDQESRFFLDWKVIEINSFEKHASRDSVEGGHGMRPEGTHNPTRLCQVKFFKSIKPQS